MEWLDAGGFRKGGRLVGCMLSQSALVRARVAPASLSVLFGVHENLRCAMMELRLQSVDEPS